MTRAHLSTPSSEGRVLLDPPGPAAGWAQELPHWPYVQAVDAALTGRDLAPSGVRAYCTGAGSGGRIWLILIWEASRTAGPTSIRFHWDDERGWAYARCPGNPRIPTRIMPLTPLRCVFARPEDLAAAAETIVREGRVPVGEFGAEWDRAAEVRTAISLFRP